MSSVDGLVSGMNTTDIIRQLMQLERQPVVRLQSAKATADKAITALQGLNTRFAALVDLAKKLNTAGGWSRATATSSQPDALGVTVSDGATPTSLSFTVKSLAAAHQLYSTQTYASDTTLAADPAKPITIGYTDTAGAAASLEITSHDGTLAGIASAVNADANSPVAARVVKTSETGDFRLEFTARRTGATSAFTVSGIAQGANPDMAFTTATQASNAEILLGSSGTPMSVTSSTNTITGVAAGVTLSLKKADPSTVVTVDVARDAAAISTDVEKLVAAANEILGEIKTLTAQDPVTKKSGVLRGNTVLRQLQSDILQAVAGAVGTTSAGSVGLELTRNGTLTFDKTKFDAAYAADPAATAAVFNGANGGVGVSQRLVAIGERATAFSTGTLTQLIDTRRTDVKRIDDSIATWDVKLAAREARFRKQFAALERALGSAQQQGNWLSSQIASLPRPS